MGNHAFAKRPVLGVGHAEVSTRLLHDLRDRRVVDVADLRKQVVLDLEVQAAEEPRDGPAGPGEVRRRLRLVDGPGPLDTPRGPDRKSTRLNSSHANISYAVFCLKKKKT